MENRNDIAEKFINRGIWSIRQYLARCESLINLTENNKFLLISFDNLEEIVNEREYWRIQFSEHRSIISSLSTKENRYTADFMERIENDDIVKSIVYRLKKEHGKEVDIVTVCRDITY